MRPRRCRTAPPPRPCGRPSASAPAWWPSARCRPSRRPRASGCGSGRARRSLVTRVVADANLGDTTHGATLPADRSTGRASAGAGTLVHPPGSLRADGGGTDQRGTAGMGGRACRRRRAGAGAGHRRPPEGRGPCRPVRHGRGRGAGDRRGPPPRRPGGDRHRQVAGLPDPGHPLRPHHGRHHGHQGPAGPAGHQGPAVRGRAPRRGVQLGRAEGQEQLPLPAAGAGGTATPAPASWS